MLLAIIALNISLLEFHVYATSPLIIAKVLISGGQVQSNGQEISSLKVQAEAGDPEAQVKLARAYEMGDGVPQNEEMAFDWYKKAAEQGNSKAQNRVGEMYRGGDGVDQDKQEAILWYHKAARQGEADAMCNLGVAYYNGDGVDIDDRLSYAWFLLAKEAGCERAAEAVQRAESELRPPVITEAFDRIAEMYEKGEYLPSNQTEAARWWLKAANRGDGDAEVAIGMKLVVGQGVPQDANQGRHLCNEALKRGAGGGAEYCLGYMYQFGLGVVRDPKEARKWYELAAKWGHELAMKMLAYMEATGEGGKLDRVAACVLYGRLAAKGDKDALRSLAKLKSEIDVNEWKKVEKKLRSVGIEVRDLPPSP